MVFGQKIIVLMLAMMVLSVSNATENAREIVPSVTREGTEQTQYSFVIESDDIMGTIPAGQALYINGNYAEGERIRLIARPMPGYNFDRWVSSGGGTFEDECDPTTYFTMPANNVIVTAIFKLIR
jgi:hypothetical protein